MWVEKNIDIGNLEVNYKIAGAGPALFILHGWGRGSDSWESVQIRFAQEGYKVVVPDLPGFGKTPAPKSAWGVREYADFVLQFSEALGMKKFILLGHSFGGQVAVEFAAFHGERLEKLILCAPAAIRREPGLKENVIKYVAKTGSIVLSFIPSERVQDFFRQVFARIIGRMDYLQAPGIMRKVMQKVIREDLSALFPKISTDTLLVWGEKDRPVPLEHGYAMKERMPHASLSIIPGVGHRIHQEVPERLSEIILAFITK